MKRGREHSLKGTWGLGGRKEFKSERKKEESRDNKEWQKRELKQRTDMTGKQTNTCQMKDTASVLACTEICEKMCWILTLSGDKLRHRERVWAGIRHPERRGGGQSSGRNRPCKNLLWNTRLSQWVLFVCFFYFHPLFIITTTPFCLLS